MELIQKRLIDDGKSTIGELYLNGDLFCGALEDTKRMVKVAGETRIPAQRYEIKMRYDSPMVKKYRKAYGVHGLPWLQNVPDFQWVYIHIGNDAKDSHGCILVGYDIAIDVKTKRQRVLRSTECFKDLHTLLFNALQAGEGAFITILDN